MAKTETPATVPLTAPEIIDKMVGFPSLDLFLDRNPKHLSEDDLRQYIDVQRHRRAMYIEKGSE